MKRFCTCGIEPGEEREIDPRLRWRHSLSCPHGTLKEESVEHAWWCGLLCLCGAEVSRASVELKVLVRSLFRGGKGQTRRLRRRD